MKGKWASGIPPRYFTWIVKDCLAVSERPGGYSRNHRPVRRQEEIIWLREQGFTRVISLLGSPHNLHAYDEQKLAWSHFPMPHAPEATDALLDLYRKLHAWLAAGERVLVHEEDLGDKVLGVVGGYLLWSGMVPSDPIAIAAIEKMCQRQIGAPGREFVKVVARLPGDALADQGA